MLKRKIASIFGSSVPEYRLKSAVWSPFRGDTLYPFFDDTGDMIAFSREYKKQEINGLEITVFMTVTHDKVYSWIESDDSEGIVFNHGFEKIPVMYVPRKHAYCDTIRPIRLPCFNRLMREALSGIAKISSRVISFSLKI